MYCYTTSSTSDTTITDAFSDLRDWVNRLERKTMELNNMLMYLTEEEIKDYCNKIIERDNDNYNITNMISAIVEARHFSEEFLKEFFNYIRMDSLWVQHRGDIISGQYSGIKLLLIAKEEQISNEKENITDGPNTYPSWTVLKSTPTYTTTSSSSKTKSCGVSHGVSSGMLTSISPDELNEIFSS